MTRRDYEIITGVLRDTPRPEGVSRSSSEAERRELVEAFADRLERENPRFDRDRFRKAAQS